VSIFSPTASSPSAPASTTPSPSASPGNLPNSESIALFRPFSPRNSGRVGFLLSSLKIKPAQ
jgi:hypothetical protein